MVSSVSRTVECFYPGKSFPAISVTGSACSLNCKHCARRYLDGMVPATTPDDLLTIAEALAERGAKGFLLSGGVDPTGRVDLSRFVSAIREIKDVTNLEINAHIGLTPRKEIEELVASGIDSFSVDVYGDRRTIEEVLGLDARPEDYLRVVSDLKELGAPTVAPHICVGVHAGALVGEYAAIDGLAPLEPPRLILISLIPTKGTPYEHVRAPSLGDMVAVVERARKVLPKTKLLLGCMRSKKDRSSEVALVRAGLDGIVLPSTSTVERLRADGFRIRKRAECCSLP